MDRNPTLSTIPPMHATSLSARRAWIEIAILGIPNQVGTVALRKESVDRNKQLVTYYPVTNSRSPQGERG